MGMVGVCTCDTVAGDYTFVNGFQPDGQRSLDMGLFQDLDGSAYLVRSVDNKYAGFSQVIRAIGAEGWIEGGPRGLAGCFLALGSGLRLVGIVPLRR